ncbi:hypothetical protein AB833_11035 [Chromatiales bacterium (ex Bugula neritina AB1)]|nr:hypothetical protein AB833_11035 [Chromatiales bacterium (ex Bugula neritina AB1)]
MSFLRSPARQHYFEQVWVYVRNVPFGKVVTYGQIARALPGSIDPALEDQGISDSQLVGIAMAACPEDVPWHRVINAQGRVSTRPDSNQQEALLEAEGIRFHHGRLSLDEYQWFDTETADKPQQHSLF